MYDLEKVFATLLHLQSPSSIKNRIFSFKNKEAVRNGRGQLLSAKNNLVQVSKTCTHWTPNFYLNSRSYCTKDGVVGGHSEKNLSQINLFVVDIDSKEKEFTEILLDALDFCFFPTVILETAKGYQALYALEEPLYITSKTEFRTLKIAKLISENLRRHISSLGFEVDQGCNHFGISRIPKAETIIYFDKSKSIRSKTGSYGLKRLLNTFPF